MVHWRWSGSSRFHVQRPCGWTGLPCARHAGQGVHKGSPGVVSGIMFARNSGVSRSRCRRAVCLDARGVVLRPGIPLDVRLGALDVGRLERDARVLDRAAMLLPGRPVEQRIRLAAPQDGGTSERQDRPTPRIQPDNSGVAFSSPSRIVREPRADLKSQIRNFKSEIRNKFETQNPNVPNRTNEIQPCRRERRIRFEPSVFRFCVCCRQNFLAEAYPGVVPWLPGNGVPGPSGTTGQTGSAASVPCSCRTGRDEPGSRGSPGSDCCPAPRRHAAGHCAPAREGALVDVAASPPLVRRGRGVPGGSAAKCPGPAPV